MTSNRAVSTVVAFFRDHQFLTWISVTALMIRLVVLWPAFVTDTTELRHQNLEKATRAFLETRFNVEDASQYFHEAGLISRNRSLEALSGFRTPGYSLFLSGTFLLFGENIALVFILQAILGTGTVILIHRLAAEMVGERAARAAAGFAAVDPHLVFYGATLMTETLFGFVFLLGILILWKSIPKGSGGLFLTAGIMIGLATMVRPTAQFFPIVALGLIVALSPIKPGKKTFACALFLLGFVAMIVPWSARNATQFGYFRISSAAGLNLLHQHAAQTVALREGRPLKEVRKELTLEARSRGATQNNMTFENLGIFSGLAMEKIRDNWLYYPAVHTRGILNTFSSLGTSAMSRYFDLAERPDGWKSPAGPQNGPEGRSSTEILLGIGIAVFLLVI